MTTKQRFRNKYRLEIREDDHPPMHAHLVGGGVDVLIDLETLVCVGAFASWAIKPPIPAYPVSTRLA